MPDGELMSDKEHIARYGSLNEERQLLREYIECEIYQQGDPRGADNCTKAGTTCKPDPTNNMKNCCMDASHMCHDPKIMYGHGVGTYGAEEDYFHTNIDGSRPWSSGPKDWGNKEDMGGHLAEDVATLKPNFKVLRGNLRIEKNTYKLQTEKAYMRIRIDIIKASLDNGGNAVLTIEHPVTGREITSKIRKVNFDKVINGAKRGRNEITVENEEGKEFYLVKV